MSCIFCESPFADPILPHNRQKICVLFDVSFNGKKLLHDGRVCTRCHVQVELIDNAVKLKSEMNQCLQEKLGRHEKRSANSANGSNPMLRQHQAPTLPVKTEKPAVVPAMNNDVTSSHPSPSITSAASIGQPMVSDPILNASLTMNGGHSINVGSSMSAGPLMNVGSIMSVPTPLNVGPIMSVLPPLLQAPPTSAAAAEMMAMASFQSSLAALTSGSMMSMSQPTSMIPPGLDAAAAAVAAMPNGTKDGVCMCVHCGKACKDQAELVAHDALCIGNRTGDEYSLMGCDRCGQSFKYRFPEDRIKHIVQCKGQGLRRGRPSTGIVNCPKCGLSLKNRMNHDRINHVQRCTGSGLKRGRPSLKSVEKFQCDKCTRNLWSREQLELHSAKCDGSFIERRGRKPGDNICMVCGDNLIYRYILKKHLRQVHGINPQILDDSSMAAVKTEHSVDGQSPPYKHSLMDQIQQQLSTPTSESPMEEGMPAHTEQQRAESEDSLGQSYDSTLSHRKKAVPYKRTLMDQIQQQLSTATSESPMEEGMPALTEQRAESEDSLGQSYDSALSHRKKAVPYKYVASDGGLYSCDKCAKSFEYQHQYEQHDCRDVTEDLELQDGETLGTEQSLSEEMYEDSSHDGLAIDELKEQEAPAEQVDDVISAISERAEAVGSGSGSSGVRGSAIAQVISGLLVANKLGTNNNSNNNSSNSNSTLPSQTHRQSIST